jgi:hypothetical protein
MMPVNHSRRLCVASIRLFDAQMAQDTDPYDKVTGFTIYDCGDVSRFTLLVLDEVGSLF